MRILVTGAAGFIGFSTSLALLERGDEVVGLDNVNDYYDVQLKHARLSQLKKFRNFRFEAANIGDLQQLENIFRTQGPFPKVLHLAANAGVRYSQQYPLQVINSNVVGHANILQLCRLSENFEHLVFASSSSIYSQHDKLPFSVENRVDRPVSIYAATKAADELISHVYADNFNLPQSALRYFTVYGPWGRPDMSYYLFSNAITNSTPIRLFNFGNMHRDFTYIDDIVSGTVAALDNPPSQDSQSVPIQAYNLGAGTTEPLEKMVSLLEHYLGMKAEKIYEAGPRGEMLATYADIKLTTENLGYSPAVCLEDGMERFVHWYQSYHR
ncbi:MAG: NAD-dependent epimerase/dehydratase family protein [Acidiferrobacterales bacterium]|nr:NAD-dependent epimerase/dehydratase family protein [Acidiferrobacterales bacterium]